MEFQLDANTVIRTGYGMFYLPVDVRWDDAPHNLFINSFNTPWLTYLSDGVTPQFPFSNPFPASVGGIRIGPPFDRFFAIKENQQNFRR